MLSTTYGDGGVARMVLQKEDLHGIESTVFMYRARWRGHEHWRKEHPRPEEWNLDVRAPVANRRTADVGHAAVHAGVRCDGCDEHNIAGTRFICQECPNYDLCETCYNIGVHDKTHRFASMAQPGEPLAQLLLQWHEGDPRRERRFGWRATLPAFP